MDDLRDRARRAYEWSRVRHGLPWLVPGLLLAVVATGAGVVLALGLGGLLVGFSWYGRDLARGNLPGLAVGVIGAGAPILWESWMGACCAGAGCADWCLAICALGGAAGGAVLLQHLRRTGASWTTVAAALTIASLATSVGCLQVGATGLIGVVALWAFTAPVVLVKPARI